MKERVNIVRRRVVVTLEIATQAPLARLRSAEYWTRLTKHCVLQAQANVIRKKKGVSE